jgi:YgiT-type zinc finger domain-containing protein
MSYDYGTCHVCGGQLGEELTEQSINQSGEWVLIRAVPTGICQKCGEQVFRWEVTQRLEDLLRERNAKAPESRIEVPVYAF